MVPQFYPKLQWRGKTRGSSENMSKHNAKAGGKHGRNVTKHWKMSYGILLPKPNSSPTLTDVHPNLLETSFLCYGARMTKFLTNPYFIFQRFECYTTLIVKELLQFFRNKNKKFDSYCKAFP